MFFSCVVLALEQRNMRCFSIARSFWENKFLCFRDFEVDLVVVFVEMVDVDGNVVDGKSTMYLLLFVDLIFGNGVREVLELMDKIFQSSLVLVRGGRIGGNEEGGVMTPV